MSNKRKATEAPVSDVSEVAAPSLPIDLDTKTSQEISAALLSLLPHDATFQHDNTKKLFRAFDLAKSEMMLRSSESVGSTRPFAFLHSQVTLPKEIVLCILDFVPRPQLVHNVSLVSKAWLSATRNSCLWSVLDTRTGLAAWKENRKLTISDMLSILNRPQFANLKSLVLPNEVELGVNGLSQIASICPLLEKLDLGHECSDSTVTDQQLQTLPTIFPHLSKIGVRIESATDTGIRKLITTMGERLLEIKIMDYKGEAFLEDDTLRAIGEHCPNLAKFGYKMTGIKTVPLTEAGVEALVHGCPKLSTLVLLNTKRVGLAVFESLANDEVFGANLSYLHLYRMSVNEDNERARRIRQALEKKVETVEWRHIGPFLKLYHWSCYCGKKNEYGICRCM